MRWKDEHMKIGVSAVTKHTGHSRSFIFSSIDFEMKSTKVSLTILHFFLNSKSVLYNSSLSVVFLSFLFCRQSIFFVKLPFSISFSFFHISWASSFSFIFRCSEFRSFSNSKDSSCNSLIFASIFSFFDWVITQVNKLVLRSFLISSISFLISFALLS